MAGMGWQRELISIFFKSDPSIKSSLKSLRKTEWARKKTEELYVSALEEHSARTGTK
jgi:uncharacterized protein (DUF2132 family)